MKVLEADAAALRLNQYFDQVQKSVNGLATQPHVVQALSSRNEIPATEVQLADSLPGIEAVHLFPYRDIPRWASPGLSWPGALKPASDCFPTRFHGITGGLSRWQPRFAIRPAMRSSAAC